jgi:hypothetical protein
VLGFPIRTSADRGPVDGSPQLFAVTHVLHRFLAPRHPPLALCSLEEQRCSCLLCSSQRASPASGPSSSRETVAITGHAVAAELEGSCRARGLDVVQLPQNGREDKVDRFDFERSKPQFRTLTTDPPMHQLGTGSNRTGRMPAND